jgi:chromosome segregation ATPase
MNKNCDQLQDGINEMEATIERLREEIQCLTEQRDALEKGNLELYRKLTDPDF